MGAGGQAIKMAIIDHRNQQKDFEAIMEDSIFQCGFSNSWQQFLERQNPKGLSYIIVREEQERDEDRIPEDIREKMRESSLVAKTYKNYYNLERQFIGHIAEKKQLIRSHLISYIRKYQMEKIVVYLFVDRVYEFKLAEYEEPYIFKVSNDIEQIKKSILKRPEGDDSLNFKFRRLVKDLFRRTVVRIFTEEDDKEEKKLWKKHLGDKITQSISVYSEKKFRSNLISNYYDFIVVSSSQTFRAIEDFKKTYKFESEIIYYGDLEKYGNDEQSEEKIKSIQDSLWMHNKEIGKIAKAIINCTDILAEETSMVAKNVVIFTKVNYGREHEEFIKKHLKEQLMKEPPKRQSKDITKHQYQEMNFTVVTSMKQANQQFNKAAFSYLVTFDCDIEAIQNVKALLRQLNYDKRAYMYNADEEEGKAEEVQENLHDKQFVKKYLEKRIKKVIDKCAFKIKFEIGPIDQITIYKDSSKEIFKFTKKMGLISSNIPSLDHFEQHYLAKNRQLMIAGNTIIIRVKDYLFQYLDLLKEEQRQLREMGQDYNYMEKVKVIIYDRKEELKKYWKQLKRNIESEMVSFVHYNFNKIRDFLEIMVTPRINLTTFIKKSLPNFIAVQQKIATHKFVPIDMVAQIVTTSKHLKQVFNNQNFELNKQFPVSFYKLSNSNKNFEESISFMHDQFIYRYSILWRTGYDVIDIKLPQVCLELLKNDIKQCLYRCKSYLLIDVSEEQFDYFYINRIEQCNTFIDLQINVIYIYSLPHGLSNAIQLIFSSPLSTRLTPKIFVGFMVTLFFAFCSFEDEVMKKKKLIVYVDDPKVLQQQDKSVLNSLKIGDVLFNKCFLFSGKYNERTNNDGHNCLFLQFEDIPMLSETRVKNYLHIERFSFYKENTEYLIAPYTEFTIKNITITKTGKRHITLSATNNSKKGFVYKVFAANGINQGEMFEVFKEEIDCMDRALAQDQNKIRGVESYYKKAEMIGLYEQKEEMMKSMKQGLQYEYFLKELNRKKYMTALSNLKRKQKSQKITTQIQAAYFNKMLGVQKALLYYNICQYDISLKQLEKLHKFLMEENVEKQKNWTIKKIQHYSHCVSDLSLKRQKYMNRLEKTKEWTIETAIKVEEQKVEEEVIMGEEQIFWDVGYDPKLQQFYIQPEGKQRLYYYNNLPAFGDLPSSFPAKTTYQTASERFIHDVQKELEKNMQMHQNESFLKKKQSESQDRKIQFKRDEKKQKTKIQPTTSLLDESKLNTQKFITPIIESALQIEEKPEKQKQNKSNEISGLVINSVVNELQKKQNNQQPSKVHFKQPQEEESERPKVKPTNSWLNQNQTSSIKPSKLNLTKEQELMGVKDVAQWQVFYFNDKFVLTQKKHYKVKVPNKYF